MLVAFMSSRICLRQDGGLPGSVEGRLGRPRRRKAIGFIGRRWSGMGIAVGGKRSVGETDSDKCNRLQHSGGHATSHGSAISLAAAADALDLAVEGCVFLAQRVVRIAQVLLVGHIAGAWLPMADRRLYRHLRLRLHFRPNSSKRTTNPAQTRPGRRSEPPALSKGLFSASWFSRFVVCYVLCLYRAGTSIAPQLRRP